MKTKTLMLEYYIWAKLLCDDVKQITQTGVHNNDVFITYCIWVQFL